MSAASSAARRLVARRAPRALALGLMALTTIVVGQPLASASAAALTGVDLSTYVRVGRYDLPEPSRTTAPTGSLLAQEASGVTYDWDTDTLFVVGDGGTSVVQVSKTGALIDSMTLAGGGAADGIASFYDTEGITYVGGGRFVLTEERFRRVDLFTYAAGTTLTRSAVQTVKLGTTIGNVGIEGITNDPQSGGFIAVKETDPEGIFQTGIDFDAGTATNGSATTENSTNLFTPSLAGLSDFSDVYALANVTTLTGADTSHLLVISQESGKVVNIDRSGTVSSTLTLVSDPDNPLSIQAQTDEGVTLDRDGNLYVVNEQGGGDTQHPQLWVFAPSTVANTAPTAVTLTNPVTAIAENTSTASRFKVADVSVADDGLGTNNLTVTGADASAFEVDSSGLYLKAGTTLDRATKSTYSVSVAVDDPSLGTTPDATSAAYTLTLTAAAALPAVKVTEVSPWSSGSSSYKADWFELTNTGTTPVDLTGWKMNDSAASSGSAVALNGVSSLAAGQSAIFLQGDSDDAANFESSWFASGLPSGFTIGYYDGPGLGTGGDGVTIFNAADDLVTGIAFGVSTTGRTFDNAAGAGSTSAPFPTVSTLSTAGTNGAFTASGEVGSPGTIGTPLASVTVSEVMPTGSSAADGADWFELTNTGGSAVALAGWKMDDDSNTLANAVALNGVDSLAPGQSAVFIEGTATTAAAFTTAWFGSSVPSGFAIGYYSGAKVSLGSGGDQVNVFDAPGNRVTGVAFGTSPTVGVSFDNAAGLGSSNGTAPPTLNTPSTAGTNGAFASHSEIGSPGRIANPSVPSSGGSTPTQSGGTAVTTTTTDAASTAPPVTGPPSPSTPTPATATTPAPKAKTPKSATAKALDKGVKTTLTGLKAKSRITVTIRLRGKTLRTIKATAAKDGTGRVTLALTKKQLAALRGKHLTLRFTVIDADGTTRTLSRTLTVK